MNTPLCVLCTSKMYCDSIGHYAVLYSGEELHHPDTLKGIYVGDMYKCPTCGYEIITDWGVCSVENIKTVTDAIETLEPEYLHLVKSP